MIGRAAPEPATAAPAVAMRARLTPRARARAVEAALVLGGFSLLTLILTWPAILYFGQAINAFGDVVVQMTTLAWDAHALATDPLHLFEAPFFYPYAHSNAFSEHLLGETLITLPWLWLTGDPAPAHNFNFLISFVLTAAGTYLLVRDLTGNRLAAVGAGIAYAFAGYRFAQSGHLQTLATEWFPLTLWALRRGLRRNHGGYLALAAACVVAMGLFSVYYIYFLAILVGLYLVWWLLVDRRVAPPPPAPRPLWLKGGIAAAGALLLLLPIYVPYLQVNAELGFNRSVYEVQTWAAEPGFYFTVLSTNWLWATLLPRMIGTGGERQLFPGLIITLLAVGGLLAGGRVRPWPARTPAPPAVEPPQPEPRPRNHERWFYLILAAAAVLLTFGLSVRLPGLGVTVPLPYAVFYDWLPGFSALRVPVRFVALLNLALAVLGGYGLAALLRGRGRRALALVLPLLVLMTLEYVQVRDLSNHRDMRPPAAPADSYLATHPGPVVELPMHGDVGDVWYTYEATYHWQPLVNGFSSFVPPGTTAVAHTLAHFPDPASVALLQGLAVQHVLIHLSQYPAVQRADLQRRLAATPSLTRVFDGNGDAIYRVAPDLWPARAVAALPPDGYLWLGRGSSGGDPALEVVGYALTYDRLPGVRLPVPSDHVRGDRPIGYRALPALPYGRAADVALQPAGDPAGGRAVGAAAPLYANALAAIYGRTPGLLTHYDLTAPSAPQAPHGLALPARSVTFAPTDPPPPGAPGPADLLLAAFAPAHVVITGTGGSPLAVDLAPGLTRVRVPNAAPPGGGLALRLAAPGAAGAAHLLAVDLYTAGSAPPPAGPPTVATGTLVLDLEPSTANPAAGTVTTAWRVVPRHPDGAPFTVTLDVYKRPYGTHPAGHLGSWSLPLPAGEAGLRFTVTLHPADKTATATLNGGTTPIYAWQGPPTDGDYAATLNLLTGDQLLLQLPVYDFTLDGGQLTAVDAAPGGVVRLPFAAP